MGKNIDEIVEHHGHITRPAVVQLFNEFGYKSENIVMENIDRLIWNVTKNANNTERM